MSAARAVEAKIVASGLQEPETPVSLGGAEWLVAEMGAGCVSRLDLAAGTVSRIARTGRPNGVAVDRDGSIWVAESFGLGDDDVPGLKRIDPAGRLTAVTDRYGGVPIRWPNDIAVGPDGAVYFTDTGVDAREIIPERKPVDYDQCDGRVYRYDPHTSTLTLLDQGMAFANGLAFGPRGELYITESGPGLVHRYELADSGTTASKQTLAAVIDPDGPHPPIVGTDGIAAGPDGRLYVAIFGQGQLAVLDPDGSIVGRIPTGGAFPTNCAFGPDGRLYVTECEQGLLLAFKV
jgi:gluconolactonase